MLKKSFFRTIMAGITTAVILLSSLGAGTAQTAEKASARIPVKWWISSVNSSNTGMAKALEIQKDLYFSPDSKGGAFTIKIDDKKRYQKMDGFGASFTEASAWLMTKKLDEKARKELMTKLFDKTKGIGLSMLRQPIGACDHVIAPYTYDDKPDTDDLPNFSIAHDLDSIVPSIKEALSVNPGRVKVMCATWSPPGWMKSNDSERGTAESQEGTLLDDKYGAYANYI